MIGKCDWKEEQLFDFVYGTLPKDKEQALILHLQRCVTCRKQVNEWQQIVETMDDTVAPSPLLKKRLNKRIRKETMPKRRKRLSSYALASVGSVIIFLAAAGLFLFQKENNDEYLVKQQEDVQEGALVNDPMTDQFNVVPLGNFHHIEGKVWINDVTNEMLMKVDGLIPVVEKDYQLWLIQNNNEFNGELLQPEEGKILVYYRGTDLHEMKLLQVSLEQKGGSEKPSGVDTFYVDLTRK